MKKKGMKPGEMISKMNALKKAGKGAKAMMKPKKKAKKVTGMKKTFKFAGKK